MSCCSDESILEFYKYIIENKDIAYSKGILKSMVEDIIKLRGLDINNEKGGKCYV
jgi:hypothetical protein